MFNSETEPKMTISFAAAGWLQTYHFGVSKAIQELGLCTDDVRFCGSSAGSLAAAALLSNVDFEKLLDYAVGCVTDCRSSLGNAFRIRDYVLVGIERFAVAKLRDDASLKPRLNKQLEVYCSILPWCKQKVIREFDTAEDLEEALVASCCLVPLAGLPLRLRKSREVVCDGGLTAFQPRKGQPNVITVSAMYFNSADIRPSCFVPLWWGLYPPNETKYRELFDMGFNDAVRFFVKEGLVPPSELNRLRSVPTQSVQTGWDVLLDLLTGAAFMLLLRPWALVLIYTEMLIAAFVHLVIALVQFTRTASWERVYHSLRNIVSARVLLHFVLGDKVEVNLPRLEKHSRVYRILKPLIYHK